MAKKTHKADEYVLQQIASAKTFAAVMFLGRGKYLCENHETLADARNAVSRMDDEHGQRTGRRAWVSAIDDRGAPHPVPDGYETGVFKLGYVRA